MADRSSKRDRRIQRFQPASSPNRSESATGIAFGGPSRYEFAGIEKVRPKLTPEEQAEQLKLQTELRKEYSDLIETCQNFRDSEGIEQDLESVMKENIRQGKRLFKKIDGTTWGPGDMYMAFLHTKMCSGMILSKTEKIGNSSSGFTLDGFLNAIMEKSHNRIGEYCPELSVATVCTEAKTVQKLAPSLTVLLGSFDRNTIATPPEAKEKKVRAAPRRKLDCDEANATHHEEIRLTEAERERQSKDSPEAQSKEILRILTTTHKAKKAPENLFEFTMNKDSVASFFENLFYVSFLVRDGFVSINRRKRRANDSSRFDTDLLIAPEEPPKKQKESGNEDSAARKQHIISFNSAVFKALANASQGPPTIKRRSASSRK